MPTRISVALCTYNSGRYLRDELDSIGEQTLLPNEVVACDDGSHDDTVGILQRFKASAPFPVRIVRNEVNLRVTKNFERAISLCDGDLIALADADDVWYPRKLEVMARALIANPVAGYSFHDGDLIDDGGRLLNSTMFRRGNMYALSGNEFAPDDQVPILLRANVVWGSAMMMRSDVRHLVLPISPRWAQDSWITMVLSLVGRYGIMIPESLYKYRLHQRQAYGVPPNLWSVTRNLKPYPLDVWAKEIEMFADLQRALQANLDLTGRCKTRDLDLIKGKMEHLAQRHMARTTRGWRRAKTVLVEWFTGRYAKFSLSWKSALRDLCV
jgi:glycosyltransferase involved in cell wall biosynthesis